MLLNIETVIVFIAEIIIAYTLFNKLLILDKSILHLNNTLSGLNPEICEISVLIRKISAQYVEFAHEFEIKIINKRNDSIIKQLNKILVALLLMKLNFKFIKKIRKSKPFKVMCKGLSILKYVV